ncbi:MAG: hypothetical protein ABIB43_00815 [archaeon]
MDAKTFIFILLLIIGSSLVFGFDELFDDYVYSMDSFQLEDDIYHVQLADNEKSIIVHKNQELYQVRNGTCADTAYYQYCFMGLELDYEDHGRPIPGTMGWEPAILFQVFSKKPDVEILRSHVSKINRDEKASVTVTITNEGKLNIYTLKYEELIPGTATIFSTGADVQNLANKITWSRPILVAGDSIVFVYQLKSTGYDEIILKNATLSYVYEDSSFTDKPSLTDIDIQSPFALTNKFDKKNADLEENFIYTFEIKNTDDEDTLNVELALTIPESLDIMQITQGFKKERNLIHTFKLAPTKTETLSITLQSKKAGNYSIQSKTTMNIRNEVIVEDKKHNITIDLQTLKPELKLSKSEVYEGNYYTVSVYMENPAEIYFYDISGKLHGGHFETRDINLASINPKSTKELFSEAIKAIPVDEDTKYTLRVQGRYRTINNQYFNFDEEKELTIKPVTVGFDIKKTVSPSIVYPGQEVTVKVSVNNLGQKISIVSVEEEIPEVFGKVTGLSKKTITLGIGAEEEFYIYRITVPKDIEPGTYTLNSHLNYEDLVIKDEPFDIVVKLNETTDDVSNPDDSNPFPVKEEKKGFFGRIIQFFKDFFS